jgi:large subunit ribosomal protein L13
MNKTYSLKENAISHNWHLFNANDKILGRLATNIVSILMGKYKVNYTPHMDNGDYVIVINACKILLSGGKDKKKNKMYHHHTGYPKGLRSISYQKLMEKNPCRIIEKAVKGMLPKNKLGSAYFRRLKIYKEDEHMHTAQNNIITTHV